MSKVAVPRSKSARKTPRKSARIALSSRRQRSKSEDRLDGMAATNALKESAERIPYQKARRDLAIVELIETGLEAREREKRRFFELADRLADSADASKQKRLKEELARMTFGD